MLETGINVRMTQILNEIQSLIKKKSVSWSKCFPPRKKSKDSATTQSVSSMPPKMIQYFPNDISN